MPPGAGLAFVLLAVGFIFLPMQDFERWLAVGVFVFDIGRSFLACALVPMTGLLLGHGILRGLRGRWGLDGEPSLVLSLALGWGVMSWIGWLVAGLGTFFLRDFFQPLTAWIVLAAALLLCRKDIGLLLKAFRRRFRLTGQTLVYGYLGAARYLMPLGWILLGLVLLRLVLTALTPSFLYDVLEYHLPAMRQLMDAGSFAPITANAYTEMPQAVETLYAWAGLFEGGVHAAKITNLFLALTTVLLLNAMLRKWLVPASLRFLAVLLFLLHPVTYKLLADAYVGMGSAMFATAAVVCWLRACRLPNRLDPLLGAVFMAFALSVKYPVMGVAVIPFFLCMLAWQPTAAMVPALARRPVWLCVPGSLAAGVVVLVVAYAPWLLRGFIYGRSPFPPLTMPWFGEGMDAPIRACMAWYHRPLSPMSAEFWSQVLTRLPAKAGFPLVLATVGLAVSPASDRRRRGLGAFLIVGMLFWSSAPNAEDRFLAPLLPGLAAALVLVIHDIYRWQPIAARLLKIALIFWIGILLFSQSVGALQQGFFRMGLGMMEREEFFEKQIGPVSAEFFQAIENSARDWVEKYKATPKIMMLYEARAAAFDRRYQLRCNTVFNYDAFWTWLYGKDGVAYLAAKTQAEPISNAQILYALQMDGFSHFVINEVELARLLDTYPAIEAHDDPLYRRIQAQPRMGAIHPPMLQVRHFYPPVFYAAGKDDARKYFNRLDSFIAYMREQNAPIHEQNIGGCRMLVFEIPMR